MEALEGRLLLDEEVDGALDDGDESVECVDAIGLRHRKSESANMVQGGNGVTDRVGSAEGPIVLGVGGGLLKGAQEVLGVAVNGLGGHKSTFVQDGCGWRGHASAEL